ncbi:holin [Leclercia adecarboxylata]|uniref:holin n=1 Tax=Leclercia adecarboxylata TaxID=83655 RepID=UPI0013C5AC7D|nr:holin [Leclercia adecarboxylata]NEG94054.1 holin [Leclercia adecarboxylata]
MFPIDAELSHVAVVLLLSVLSGIGAFLHGRREGRLTGTSFKGLLLDFMTEIIIAVIAGLIAFYIGQIRQLDKPLIYLSVLLASNNGQEMISTIKRLNMDTIVQVISKILTKKGTEK